MASPLLLTIQDGLITFGGRALFENLSFSVHGGDKICLIGKNGAGKTTLMRLIAGQQELDLGKRVQQPGIVVGYLPQWIEPDSTQRVSDYVFSGLRDEKRNDTYRYMVDMVLGPLELDPDAQMDQLSGGQLRRAALAYALVDEPDILLLDEPTNHLDLAGIEWLEMFLQSYQGTVLCISHDKRFLENISDRVFWLDRGQLRICPHGYAQFDEWSEMLLAQEARELENRSRAVAQEVAWASQGVKARRKRNMRRLDAVKEARAKLKADIGSYNRAIRKITLDPIPEDESATRVVAEFFKVSKSFERDGNTKTILSTFNMRLMRGDRIGLLGHNGSGKTTFLKLLIGELAPDAGKVKRAHNLEISYFDQKREDLNVAHSLKRTLCPDGGDFVEVMGRMRHVCGYLNDFMFDPKSVGDLVGSLSGGQRNRLMLAKVLASPKSLLILDEPTNDLDMDTLEMLEDILANYTGTLVVVSHDRDFLDQIVTSVIAFEGDGKLERIVGGYSDYLEFKESQGNTAPKKKVIKGTKTIKKAPEKSEINASVVDAAKRVLSNKEFYELEQLPAKIKHLEEELESLNEQMSDPDLYMKQPQLFDRVSRRLAIAQAELTEAETRWLELEEKKVG